MSEAGHRTPWGLPPSAYAFLVALCLLLYLPGFAALPPFDRDESRFAQASTQMLETGDFVNIRFQDEARLKKPAGIYWLQSAATAVFASAEARAIWTYRVPSLLGAMLAVLLTAWMGSRLFDPQTGLLGAVMLASVVVLGVEARMAKTDAVLLATIVAAQGALAALYLPRGETGTGRGWRWPLLFWIAAGISVLIKGPLVALTAGGTAAGLAAWDRRAGWLRNLRPLAGLGIVLLIAAPWLIAITIKTHGAFFAESVGHDMLGKVAGGQEGKGLPPGYYLLTFLVTFAPWAALAIGALPWIWRHRNEPAVRFCLCWIVPVWLVFEGVPTKLLHYTLPVFPAIALLSARAFLDGAASRGRAFWAGAGLGTLGFGGLAAAVALVPWLIDRRVDPWAIAAALVAVGLYAAFLVSVRRGLRLRAVAAGLAAALVLYGPTYAVVLPAVDGLWIARSAQRLLVHAAPCAAPEVASAGYAEPSLVFLLGTEIRLTDGGGAAAHLAGSGACTVAFVESRAEEAFKTALGGRAVTDLGRVEGFNYNNGRRIVLMLYAPAR